MKSGKIIIGTLAGLAAGALLGILFAPEKGSDTRKTISKKSKDYVDALKEKFNELHNCNSEAINEIEEDVSELSDKV